jgi:hypothetical protein
MAKKAATVTFKGFREKAREKGGKLVNIKTYNIV